MKLKQETLIAKCLLMQDCIWCHAFLNDSIAYLHAPSALKHLKESHDITERTLELHVIKDFIKES